MIRQSITLALLLGSLSLLGGSQKAASVKRSQMTHRNERDILGEAHAAVLIPSSQARDDLSACVEKCIDGKLSTAYRSEPNTFPNWIEVRWPQYAVVEGVHLYFRGEDTLPEYVKISAKGLDGKWRELPSPGTTDYDRLFALPKTECTRLRFTFGSTPCGRTVLRELEVLGEAPRHLLPKPNWQGEYIWYPDEHLDNITRYFRRRFTIDDPASLASASLQVSADDVWAGWCNGVPFGRGGIPPKTFDLLPILKKGENILAFQVQDFTIDEGLLLELPLRYKDGRNVTIVSDNEFRVTRHVSGNWQDMNYQEDNWVQAASSGRSKAGVVFQPDTRQPTGFRLQTCQLPTEGTPGQKLPVKLRFACNGTVNGNWGFRVTLGETPLVAHADFRLSERDLIPEPPTSHWEKGRIYEIPLELYLPDWTPDGRCPLSITAICGTAQSDLQVNAGINVRRFDTPPVPPEFLPRVELLKVNGNPKLFINGQVVAPFIMADNWVNSLKVSGAQMAHSDAPILRVRLPDSDFYGTDDAERTHKLNHIFAALDQKIDLLTRQQPNAWLLLNVIPCPSNEWNTRNPDECTQLPNGRRFNHSFSSSKYLSESQEGLRRIVQHILISPYATRVIGMGLNVGDGPETYYWGAGANSIATPRDKLQLGDFSPCAITAFRKWLYDRYHGDVEALKRAWRRQNVDFATARPELEEMCREDTPAFRDPDKGCMAMDFWTFQSDAVANVVISLAQTIKEASGGRWLCGVMGFYNTSMNHCSGGAIGKGHHIGYTAAIKAMDSPWLDYLAAIQGYAGVNDGTPVISLLTLDSIRRRGKLFLEEYDARTFLTDLTFSVVGHHHSVYESRHILLRDFGKSVAHNHAYWWNGHTLAGENRRAVGWYDDEDILALLRHTSAIYRETAALPFHSVAEVGVFFNNRDVTGMDVVNADPILASARFNFIVEQLSSLGIPFELNCLEDLKKEVIAQYKVIVVADAFCLTNKTRDSIRRALEGSGKALVWLYAPGVVDNMAGISAKNVTELVGMNVTLLDTPITGNELKVTLGGNDPLTAGLEGVSFTPRPYIRDSRKLTLGPVPIVRDTNAKVLGSFATGEPAIAVRRDKGELNVLCSVPDFPGSLMRAVCHEAGVHCYVDTPVFLEAGNRFLSLHATAEGLSGFVYLPQPRCVLDVCSLEILAPKPVVKFTPALRPFETRIFFLGTEAEVRDLADRLHKTCGPLPELPNEASPKTTDEIPCLPTRESSLCPVESAEWTGGISRLTETQEGKEDEYILQAHGRTYLFSSQVLPIDPTKTYSLRGKFRAVPGTSPSTFYFGVQPFDEQGRIISPLEVRAFPDTETALLESVESGSHTLLVKDASRWKTGQDRCIAFDIDIMGKFSDLPNRNITPVGIEAISDTGKGWVVTLSKPLKKSWVSGTGVRQHGASARYIYCGAINQPIPTEWQELGGDIGGEPRFGITSARHWWRGTRFARIVLLMNYSGDLKTAAQFQDIRLILREK